MKLWQKNTVVNNLVEKFTVGKDREMDMHLAPFDVLGSIAHITMLQQIGLLTKEELNSLKQALIRLYNEIKLGRFVVEEHVEDVHSQIELLLTKELGEVGKKIHAARSRNDQVLVDIKLFIRFQLEQIVNATNSLFILLQQKSETYKLYSLPGYTHLQLAMPSSFGLWFGAFAESLVDDLISVQAAYKIVNKNPLGSAAGYGSSFPVNRSLTTQLLGFNDLNYNVVYAQMGRGKAERVTAQALANIADTLAKLSMDVTLYMNQQFGFIDFPPEFTTGSSIMPHKKNPDVFELIRGHCNRIKSLPNEISLLTANLPTGYHRDLQLLKEHLFPAFETLLHCIELTQLMLQNIQIKKDILNHEQYRYVFTVDAVNELVKQGISFREAYQIIGKQVEEGSFKQPEQLIQHTHEGSMGNLCNQEIAQLMERVVNEFNFQKTSNALEALLK
jgi:argininosuccinate lyase